MTFAAGAITGLALLVLQLPADLIENPPNEYVRSREFVSPVTGERFSAFVLKQQVAVIDYDYDQCPHSAVNSLAYSLVIDPVSGYVDYPESFAFTHWTAAELSEILGNPRFDRSSPPGLPWLGAYPWEMLENAAKLAEAEDAGPLGIANWWLMAGWSVRLDVVVGDNEYDTLVNQLFSKMPRQAPDMTDLNALYELRLARHWESIYTSGQVTYSTKQELAYALAWLYRGRGELVAARSWLDAAAADGMTGQYEILFHYLDSSIQLENHYLSKARDWFVTGWDAGGLDRLGEGPVAYLIAELYRRTGELETSLGWYDLASERNYGGMSQEQISRQRIVAANGRGY